MNACVYRKRQPRSKTRPPGACSQVVGAIVSALVAQCTTDLQHRLTFVSESLAFIVEFTAFYDQQSRYFKDLSDPSNFYHLSDLQQKAFIEEALTKLSTAEKQTDLLGFRATRYFHGTNWLKKFEEIHEIWSSGAAIISAWCNRQLTQEHSRELSPEERQQLQQFAQAEEPLDDSIRSNLADRLPKVADQLSQKNAELLNLFIQLLKELPAESNFFQHVPTTPTPTPESGSIN